MPVSLGPVGVGLLQAIATLARQLVDGHRGPVKLTGFYAVLQASSGSQDDRPKSIIVDCYGAKRTVEEKDLIMAEWGRQRPASADKPGGRAASSKLPPKLKAVSSGDGDGDAASGSDSADTSAYPDLAINGADLLLSLPTAKKGVKSLSQADLCAVLSSCGLRTYKQLSYNIVKAIFKRALSVIIGRGTRRGDFSWSLVTPPGLLLNKWSVAGTPAVVDGGCFIPPDSGHASQRGAGIEKKRVALCVAAHICPFWGAVKRAYFADSPVNKLALPKRFRHGDDAFAKANGRGARRNKLRKLSRDAEGKGAAKMAVGDGSPAASDDDYKLDDIADLPVAPTSIAQLAQATTSVPVEDLLALELCPLLPSSAAVSVLSLPAGEFEAVCRNEGALRAVLPRELIKRAFGLLAAADKSSAGVDLDGRIFPDAAGLSMPSVGAAAVSPVVSITVGSHPAIQCTAASLAHMSSIVSLNEQLKLCASFDSWIRALRMSTAHFAEELEFLVGARVSVGAAAEHVFSACTKSHIGNFAWHYFSSSAGRGAESQVSEAYGGCTVSSSDIVQGGQRAYMTNEVLDAGLVEMRLQGIVRIMPAYVLLTGQSASFTTCHKKRVDEDDARRKIKEIHDVMPPARYERFLMMLNLVGHHWISAEVLPQGTIHIFDSSDGGFKEEKDFAVGRVKLFAQEVGRLRRLGNRWSPLVDKWEVKYINAPVQGDGYNCGPFALAHMWCAANGMSLGAVSNVVGDHLRLAVLYTLLERGERYEHARLSACRLNKIA